MEELLKEWLRENLEVDIKFDTTYTDDNRPCVSVTVGLRFKGEDECEENVFGEATEMLS